MRGNDIRPDARIVGRQAAGRPVIGERVGEDQQRREMMLEGIVSILEGMNPRMLALKLSGFLKDAQIEKKERAA